MNSWWPAVLHCRFSKSTVSGACRFIYCLRNYKKRLTMMRILVDASSEFARVSDHEFHPVVYQLWQELAIQYTYDNGTLRHFAKQLRNRTWLHLNRTEIYDHKRFSLAQILSAKIQVSLLPVFHLRHCNHSVIITYMNVFSKY